MLIAKRLASLLGGVSQAPPEMRPSDKAEVQENAFSHRILGLRRRPPTQHVAQLTPTTTGYGSAFVHEVRQSSTDRYFVVCVGGTLKVYDVATGAEQTVVFPKGQGYLTSTKGFKAFTVGDQTYLLNMDTVVKRAAKKAAAQAYQALVFVRQADFSTRYSITLNGITVNVDTPDASSAQARLAIATDTLAINLESALNANAQVASEFSVVALGSTIYIARLDAKDFTLSTADGLADKGLKVVKGAVQAFSDLPERALNGMIVQITSDPESQADNYWVQYTDAALPGQMGVWVECAAPGTPVALDETTMPWVLQRKGVVLDDIQANALPPKPSLIPNPFSSSSGGFTSNPDTGATYSGTQDVVLTNEAQRVDGAIAGANGTQRTIRAFYDVDTTLLDYGQNVTVSLLLNLGGAGFTVHATRTYDAGLKLADEFLGDTLTVPTSSTARIQINYGGASTPTDKSRLAMVTVHGSSSEGGAGVSATYVSSILVSFPDTAIYPVGTIIGLTLNGTTYTHTVSGSDETGATVATAVAALITTGYTVTAAGAGNFTVVQTGSTPITWNPSSTVTQPTLTLFDSALTMTPGEHVGRTIVNLTDGSTGTITANGATSITVSSLLGGINDVFSPGDKCQINGSTSFFVFSTAKWGERSAGDLTSCPMPSFVDRALTEIFFFQNRLGFTADQFVVLSQSGKLTNFMRQSAVQLLDSDVIDIYSSNPNASTFDNAVEWNSALYLFSSSGHQFALTSGDSPLTPNSVSLEHKSSFPMTGGVRPITMGKYLYFGRAKSSFTQVMQYFLTVNGKADAADLTEEVPKYLSGAPVRIVGDAAEEFLAVLTTGATDTLWVYTYHYDGDQTSPYAAPKKTMSSWSKWTFGGAQILTVSMLDAVVSVVVIRSDGVYLEKIDIGVLPDGSADYRDRQGSGSLVSQTFRYRFSTLYLRDQNDVPETRGRLQLGNAQLSYNDARDFTVTVTPLGRNPYTFAFSSASPVAGDFPFTILCRNTYATVEITNSGNTGCAFSSLDWEGGYTTRAKRV